MAASQAELLKAQPLNLITTLRKFWGFGFGFGFEVLLLTLTLKPLANAPNVTPWGAFQGRLFFGFFLLAEQKKEARPPGRDPACPPSPISYNPITQP